MGSKMDGTTSVVSPALMDYYEFIRELNNSCQLDFTRREIIALVNQVDYVPENYEVSSPAPDVNEQNNVTEYSLHSVIKVDSSPRGDTSKNGVCPNTGTEKQHKDSVSSSPQPQSARSRSVLVKPELGCLIIKLTSREHLALRHYNKAEGCIEKLNSFLAPRNVHIYLSNNKPRLTVKGNCDFGVFSGSLLTLIHLVGYWWDHRKDKIKSNSSMQLSKETKSGLSEPLSDVTIAPNFEELAKTSTAIEPVDVAEDARLTDKVEGVATDRTSQSSAEQEQIENFITMLDSSPEQLLAKQCPHLCKDFPDCFNTIPDRIVSNSCEVVYICTNSKHDLFIRADQQFDIIKRLHLKFEGVRISLLRKFPAFHVLPSEGVNAQPAINAIKKLIDRCSSVRDIAEELRGMKKKLLVSNLDAPMVPRVLEATESSSNIQHQPSSCKDGTNGSLRRGPNLDYFMSPHNFDTWEPDWPFSQLDPAPMLPGHLIPRFRSWIRHQCYLDI